jgi:hypothetical protein
MSNQSSGRVNLFLFVRTHAQLQYYLNLCDSRRAANQSGILVEPPAALGNIAEIHPISRRTLRRRG